MLDVQLTAATFDAAIAQGTPVLVDFWASWCGPCQQFGPILEKLASLAEDRLVVAAVDVDAEPELAGRFGVSGIPHLLLFRNGEVVTRIVGVRPLQELQDIVFGALDASTPAAG